jgi:N-glycosylase/DNA lyase
VTRGKEKNRIVFADGAHFSPEKTLTCGQVFRYERLAGDAWRVISRGKRALLYTDGGRTIVEFDDGDGEYFADYFDLNTDYADINARILRGAAANEGFLRDAVEYGRGIRILRQDFLETVIGFIISANNNIVRIRGIIERICTRLGAERDGFFAFPTAEALAGESAQFYKDAGAGYRAPYIVKTAERLRTLTRADFADLSCDEAFAALCALSGVGPKVADCILLFALTRTEACPVDTWIAQCFNAYFDASVTDRNQMRRILERRFNALAGYVQQYLFFFKRGEKAVNPPKSPEKLLEA